MHGKPETEDYQVIARRYRPQTFQDVLGQETIVKTLKNALKFQRLAHAYLFSGPRGTGKTTFARILAKAINCSDLSNDLEPCNQCPSCKDINGGNSIDVLEIDGASNRGIDDVRKINETIGYAPAKGKYKIYIIDEVHMLTKEAFNALLKTLEEPPSHVKFFFATTELNKVLPTILSRCQKFSLRRLTIPLIVNKLSRIAIDQNRNVEIEALHMIAERSEGGLRDAESLFDQLLSYEEGTLTASKVATALGILPQNVFFQIDEAGKSGDLLFAFKLASELFDEGKDLSYFIETLTRHFQRLLIAKLNVQDSRFDEGQEKYATSSLIYRKDQLLNILELCLEAENSLRTALSPRIIVEGLLLKIFRSFTKISIDSVVERLIDLELRLKEGSPPIVKEEVISAQEKAPQKEVITKAPESKAITTPKSRHDTILQFAAVELQGKIIKK